ncbi:MAG: prepilin-type N-terminal cleavage/methylation domain-containing protein [Peptostreptococcaceae bacterium]|nr:prepilin-type N-terminal cleavage/methylation domain-containing protein [Peptostreptococcaceae bacterium]
MQKRRGFTLNEAIIALVLFSLVVGFFATIYSASYKTTRRSKSDIKLTFKGQEQVEQGLASLSGEAQRWADYINAKKSDSSLVKPADLQEPDTKLNLWGGEVKGYSYYHTIKPDKPNEQGLTADVFSFVYANARRPVIASVAFVSSIKPVPKIIYQQSYTSTNDYSYKIKVENSDVLLRAVEREYLGKKHYDVQGKKFISRPYSSRKSAGEFELTPIYASLFPEAYNIISPRTGNVLFKQNSIPKLESAVSIDMSSFKKDSSFSDVALLKTVQAQSINGFISEEIVNPYSVTWLVGLPVVDNSLIGHWDANLTFESKSDESVEQYLSNQDLSGKTLDNLLTVAGYANKDSKLNVVGHPILNVRDTNGDYRQFSNGIAIPYSDNANSRLRVVPSVTQEPITVIIRAKQLNPSGNSPLFSFNMGNDGNGVGGALGFQFYLHPSATQISYRLDRGATTPNPTQRIIDIPSNLTDVFAYNSITQQGDREGYAIYELQMIPRLNGSNIEYNASVLVNGKYKYDLMLAEYLPYNASTNGIEIGSNLEVSDIILYNRILAIDESKEITKYLLNKYTVDDKERDTIKTNLGY